MNLNMLFSKSDLSGVICLESASSILHLSTFPELPLMVFQRVEEDCDAFYLKVYSQPELDLNHTVKSGENLYITTPERTIVDLIRFEREERVIYESLNKYRQTNKDYSKVLKVASQYRCMEETRSFVNTIDDWVKDFYG